jgi:hypothetical protein
VRTVKNVYREQVCLMAQKFKEGRESVQDDEGNSCPSTSRTEESTEAVQRCLAEDRTFIVRMLEEMIGINRETLHKILVEDLKKKKVRARFVSHLLTPDQKHKRPASSVEFVEIIDDVRNVLKRIVTVMKVGVSCTIQIQNVRVQLG